MSFEFEVPLICFLFIFLLVMVYFSKPNLKLIENKYFEIILISTIIETFINTCIHLLAAKFEFSVFSTTFYPFVNFFNKVMSFLFIVIFGCILCYTIIISYQKAKENHKKIRNYFLGFHFFIFIVLCFTNIEIIQVGSITNVTGSTLNFSYFLVAILLIINLILALLNIRKLDKRYMVILFILTFIVFFAVLTIFFPGILLADLLIVSICYIMYFTIENPDVKLINELEIARDVAEKASHAKSDFLSSMSHEIRTPLNAIVGLSEDMKEYSEHMPKEVLEDIEDIGNASNTLLEIVGNILDINKIESGKMELVSIPYHLVEEVKNLVSVTTTRIGTKPIDFKLELSSDLPYILLGDKVHIKGIINNFLSNAIKYTEKGSIVLSISSVNREEDCTIFIRVTDTGKGIREEDMPHLFGKFERLDVVKNSTIEGTGLGLAITKNLVEMMGGKIGVESEFGKGSVFYAEIPQKIHTLESPVEVIEVFDVPEENTGYGNKKILLVDDNKLNIKVARKALDPFGFEITECSNGVEALECVTNDAYDLILMDIMMPVMGGEEAMEKLKEMPDFHTPVLALTADAVDGARERYLSLGFVDYLAKPFTKKELQEKLDALWKK